MSRTRVYLPLTGEDCRTLASERRLESPPRAAHAVTRALEVAHPGVDLEVHEHLALQAAARTALAAAAGTGGRVVVGAADVDPSLVVDAAGQREEPSVVRLTEPLPLARIASFHLGDAQLAVVGSRDDEEIELSWYDATELGVVISLL